jgi:two-component system, OmpR family, response regulator RegX3
VSRILFIDPYGEIAAARAAALAHDGHETDWTSSPDADSTDIDLLITTLCVVRQPECRLLRIPRPPMILLGDEVVDASLLRGFRLGLDRYLRVPFTSGEFCTTVEAVLGLPPAVPGTRAGPAFDVFRCGPATIDLAAGLVCRDGSARQLRHKELGVLRSLRHRRGRVALRRDLVREVWGAELDERTRSVDNCIRELRRKLEPDPANPIHIISVHSQGYRLITSADLTHFPHILRLAPEGPADDLQA